MTPKEKSVELMKKFFEPVRWKLGQEDVTQRAKQCALITVDEMLDNVRFMYVEYVYVKYWQEVKQEIEKIGGQDE